MIPWVRLLVKTGRKLLLRPDETMKHLPIHLKGFRECCLLSVDQSLGGENHVVWYFTAINVYFAVEFIVHHQRDVNLLLSSQVARNLLLNLLHASQSLALGLSLPPGSLLLLLLSIIFNLVDLSCDLPVYVVVEFGPHLFELINISGKCIPEHQNQQGTLHLAAANE